MAEPIILVGPNSEVDEDVDGNLVLRNTATGEEITLADTTLANVLEANSVTTPQLQQGENPAEIVAETTTPKSFTFDGTTDRDLHIRTDVTLSNSSGASATEDITVDLYEGTDNTGTLLQSETQSVTLADGASTTDVFIATEEKLTTNQTYYLEVTQSGTSLSVDQTGEYTEGGTYDRAKSDVGDLLVTDRNNETVTQTDVISSGVSFPKGVESPDAHVTKVTSDSLPHWRVYHDTDTGDVVAIDETDTEISRDPDAATVWKDATDAANAAYDPTYKEVPAAIIDGGGLEYALNSGLHVLNGSAIRNATFDMSGAGASARIQLGGPDTGSTNGGIWFQSITVKDPPVPVTFRDLVYAHIGPLLIRDAVDDGAVFRGPIGCDININVQTAGDNGVVFNDLGTTGYKGNSNRVSVRTNSCSSSGVVNKTLRNTVFNKAIGEACTQHGIVDSGHGCLWLNPTTEVNDGYGIYSNATKGHYLSPHSSNDTSGGFRFTGVSTGCRLVGPIRGNGDVSESSSATDNIIEAVDSSIFGFIGGSRTLVNGWGTNAGDPSVEGEWNANGEEGVNVYDTTNNVKYTYIDGSWR